MNFLSRLFLLLLFIISLLTFPVMASAKGQSNNNQYAEKDFDRVAVYNLCGSIKGRSGKEVIHERMDIVRKEAGVTKEDWNKHYAFKVYCSGAVLLHYALTSDLEDFQALTEYGIDLNHFFKDGSEKITTTKDLAIQKYKDQSLSGRERVKWKKVIRYVRKHKIKGCKDMPLIPCGSGGNLSYDQHENFIQQAEEIYYKHYQ